MKNSFREIFSKAYSFSFIIYPFESNFSINNLVTFDSSIFGKTNPSLNQKYLPFS